MSVGKLQRYGLPFANVVAAGTATNNVTPGRTLEMLQLKLGGTFTKAMITLFKLKANGRTLIEATGTELDKINAYRGIATNVAFLDIPFFDETMFSTLDRAVSSFDTSMGVANITTEVTIAGATSPTLTPIVVESASQKDQAGQAAPYAGLVGKVLRYPFSIANGGTLPITVPFGAQSGALIKRLHVFHGGNMTGATVKQDGMVVHESLAAENANMQVRSGRSPQSNVYTIDFVTDGNIRNALDTRDAKSLEWLLSFSAADNGTVLVEYLDSLGNL
ncbi:Viral coat protein P2, N-terminal [Methylophilaceae bacterium]